MRERMSPNRSLGTFQNNAAPGDYGPTPKKHSRSICFARGSIRSPSCRRQPFSSQTEGPHAGRGGREAEGGGLLSLPVLFALTDFQAFSCGHVFSFARHSAPRVHRRELPCFCQLFEGPAFAGGFVPSTRSEPGNKGFPSKALHQKFGVVRLRARTRSFPWAKV